ncbi:HalOD1 output domain-containing protein [Halorarum halophilum]|uniref:HalOD1 output domain-containing protein n=1 Tax=Halorarum halophilum TaxID=2743090 RepID=UPI001FEBAFB3|nr:HalOD1 output domain-containing protein [Halobaculum halophilum]
MSATEHCSPESLPPLYETLDPDALDNLIESWEKNTARQSGQVSFEYSNSLVTVDDHDSILVEARSESLDTV